MSKAIAVFLLAFYSCANTVQDKTKTMDEQQPVSADSPSQDTIRAKIGSTFILSLRCNAGAGYSWQLVDSSFHGTLQYLKEDFKNLAPDKDGGDGMQLFHFKALQAGRQTIRFIYVQPFKKPWPSNAPAKTFFVDSY